MLQKRRIRRAELPGAAGRNSQPHQRDNALLLKFGLSYIATLPVELNKHPKPGSWVASMSEGSEMQLHMALKYEHSFFPQFATCQLVLSRQWLTQRQCQP